MFCSQVFRVLLVNYNCVPSVSVSFVSLFPIPEISALIISMYYLFHRLQMITLGGDAELELVDSLDPFSEGVVFSVRPPKKSWKNIANLSGGEKVFFFLPLFPVDFSFDLTSIHVLQIILYDQVFYFLGGTCMSLMLLGLLSFS